MTTSQDAAYQQAMEQYRADMRDYHQRLQEEGFSGYGRAAYITGSGGNPEFAELQWDEMILGQAEAAGVIPPKPTEPLSPREQFTIEARNQVTDELLERGYDPWERDLTDDERAWQEARVEELVAQRLPAPQPPAPQIDTDFDLDL